MDPKELNTLYDGLRRHEHDAMDTFLADVKAGIIDFSDIENIGLPKNATDALLCHGLLLDQLPPTKVGGLSLI